MKKLGIIIFIILFFGVWGLWYLGGPAVGGINQNSAITRATMPAELTDDEKLITLVERSRAAAGRPLLDPAAAVPSSAWRLTEKDLLIAESDSPDGTRRYGQTVSQLFQNTAPGQTGTELQLALEALKEQTPDKAAAVRRGAERYVLLAAGLQNIAAPTELKYVHLNLLNAVMGLAEINAYLADILTEPIAALDQAPTFAHRYERLASAIVIVNQVLAFHNLPLIAAL